MQTAINESELICNRWIIIENECIKALNDDTPTWGGSRPGKSANKARNFEAAYEKLIKEYFSGEDSIYHENDFKTRFRVSRKVFNLVYNNVIGIDPFIQKYDAKKKKGINPLVRLAACFRALAYGNSFDREDENFNTVCS